MAQIICKACSTAKPFTEYYVSNRRTCKECVRQRVRRNRAANVAYYRDYDAKRFQNDPKVIARHKRYFATPAGKAAIRRNSLNFIAKNPDKRIAHVLLGNAVRDGRVSKPDRCSSCGSKPSSIRYLHGHHDDYSRPLDVTWLCAKCHYDLHANSRNPAVRRDEVHA